MESEREQRGRPGGVPPTGRLWFSWHIPGCHSSCHCQGTPPFAVQPSPPSSHLGRLPLTTAGPGVCVLRSVQHGLLHPLGTPRALQSAVLGAGQPGVVTI